MYSFWLQLNDLLAGGPLRPFFVFFCTVWLLWMVKVLLARSYRLHHDPDGLTETMGVSVIVPVYAEPEPILRRVLSSVRRNGVEEIIVVVDGGCPEMTRIAADYADVVMPVAKQGKRAAVMAGFGQTNPANELVIVLDSDTVWADGMLDELRKPFADPRVGGVTPRQSIDDRTRNLVRRLADWIEDLRYSMVVPAQSKLGQVGCLAGRTIAYRRAAFAPAVEVMATQQVFGIPMHVGDDRVLTNELLRRGWRTVYQRSAQVWTEAPDDWRTFWRQQLRWGRSSQRETFLSLTWLWKRPYTLLCFAADILIPFALVFVTAVAIAGSVIGVESLSDLPIAVQVSLAFLGMMCSIGARQIGHFVRYPRDVVYLPLFVLAATFFMVPIRLAAFSSMFHQSWKTRASADGNAASVNRRQLATNALTMSSTFAIICCLAVAAAFVAQHQ